MSLGEHVGLLKALAILRHVVPMLAVLGLPLDAAAGGCQLFLTVHMGGPSWPTPLPIHHCNIPVFYPDRSHPVLALHLKHSLPSAEEIMTMHWNVHS